MSRDTTVGIIVPSYNYGRFLWDCVQSVLQQDEVDLRMLIVDDASTDNSVDIARALAAADSRVELRVHPVNQGHITTYNEGLRWTSATYTVLLDSDDILTKGSLRRSCDLMDAHPEVSMVYGRAKEFSRRPGHVRISSSYWRIWSGREWFEGRCRLAENCVLQPTTVMRTRVIKEAGYFRPELPHTVDMELWLRLALYGDVGYIGGTRQAFYRVHPGSMHRSRFATELADLSQVAAAFEALFRHYKDRIPNLSEIEESTRRMLARRALDAACRMYDRGRPTLEEVAGLIELALKTYERARELSEWKHLGWRQSIGPKACLALRPLLLFTIASRSWRRVKRYRLHRLGLL